MWRNSSPCKLVSVSDHKLSSARNSFAGIYLRDSIPLASCSSASEDYCTVTVWDAPHLKRYDAVAITGTAAPHTPPEIQRSEVSG